jgi:(E)-4-hydroxy-3-methylbut-2-enyl-diphosphate synthase
MKRRKSKVVQIGSKKIGGNCPILIQSMCNVKTSKVKSVISQIKKLEDARCDIVRISVLDKKDADSIKDIVKEISIPLCADIHFDYNLALIAMKNNADKIRINPGNIGDNQRIKSVVSMAKERNIPIRIGANSGSLNSKIHKGRTLGERLAHSALLTIKYIESLNYFNLVVSAKAHSVCDTLEAYKIIAEKCAYPIHLGVTASGGGQFAIIKSSVGIGSLLSEGIGDTIRVSLAENPIQEITVGKEILQSLSLASREWEVIACPTCGRTVINVIQLAKQVESLLKSGKVKVPKSPYRIAVMGCVVNGPGESKDADIGITGGNGFGFIFKNGVMIKKVNENDLLSELIKQIHN